MTRSIPSAVLVVDDEESVVGLLDITLGQHYDVLTATTGEDALDLLGTHPEIAVAIIDQRMPGMSGTELIRRTVDDYPGLIRIILTGYTDIESLIAAINAGQVYRYLTKPWDPDELRGTVQQALEFCRIATENRLLQEDLSLANEELRGKIVELENKDRFVATLTHELRNPMAAILGYHEMLLDTATDEEQRLTLMRATGCADELNALITTTFDLSRSKQVPIDRQAVDLKDLVENLIREIQIRPLRSEVVFASTVADAVGHLDTDPLKLKMILRNLLTNALKFTRRGTIALDVEARDNGLEFRVTDSGMGIPAEALPNVFQPYTQAHGAESVRKGGAGLGLYLVQRLVSVLEGSVTVESEVGQGSTFRVWLPRHIGSSG